tara:strand:+ start:1648 stop:2148 length:501 start_codon:yes stop_codon:yes gene_type:complete
MDNVNTVVNLKQSWTLWYHPINCNDWTNSSYKKIIDIDNLYDINIIINKIYIENFHNSVFFIMKKGIFPNWEDKKNINGSCISLKISKKHLFNTWNNVIIKLFYEFIFTNSDKNKKINGISITPKKEFNILKIWFDSDVNNLNYINEYKPNFLNKNYMYKKNTPYS